ncbi:hypothetical protein RB594_002414 [Gaeumannomyces avenae]
MTAAAAAPDDARLHVAIIGGGVAGVALALGLQTRGVSFALYERAPAVTDVGAGIGLSPNAERAMLLLDRDPTGGGPVAGGYRRVLTPNGLDYFQWVEGLRTNEVRYKLHVGKDGFQGCRRSDLVEAMVAGIAPGGCGRVELGKQLVDIRQQDDDQAGVGKKEKPIEMTFADGTTARADVVVGCDGIRSRVRQVMFGPASPVSHPCYSGKFCFRTLVPMDRARAALGLERTHTRFMYNGPRAHAITYPVGQGASLVLNVLVVVTDPAGTRGWDLAATGGRQTAPGTREEARAAVEGFHPAFRAIVDLLPDNLEKWAIFDSLDDPAPTYAAGGICLAGDAAHATGPHLGAGAGFGVEDALALSTLLEAVDGAAGVEGRAQAVARALEVYDELRRERTQWLVGATREVVELFQWDHSGMSEDEHWERFARVIPARFHQIWDYDLEGMMADGLGKLGLPPVPQPN